MTTLNGDTGKRIEYSLSNVIHECDNSMYIIGMPVIVCDNKKDAEHIQREFNSFIGEISRKVLDE